MTRVLTAPQACPQCRGSGQVFFWLDPSFGVEHLDFWRLYMYLGYLRLACPLCWGHGTLAHEGVPHPDPTRWGHRVPDNVDRGS